MNKDNAAQYLPLVQALVNGATIQWMDSEGNWKECIDTGFLLSVERYRIKPKPRTAYQVYMDGASPNYAPHAPCAVDYMCDGFNAVIAAVKSGELT
jgi:hypothetical protein